MNNHSDLVNKKNIYLVVGVSQDKTKFGYKVWKTLLGYGFKAIPINPKYEEIEGEKCYATISKFIHANTSGVSSPSGTFTPGVKVAEVVAVTVVPEEIRVKIEAEAKSLGISKIWNQGETAGSCIVRDGLQKEFLV